MNESFVTKYAPEELSEIKGHPTAIKKIKTWAKAWDKGNSREPLLLYGPPGTGKTSTVECVSNEYEWPLVEINASSARTKDDIIALAQQMQSSAVDSRHQIFLLDEIDSIDGRSLSPLLTVLNNRPNPVICTANEKYKVPDSIENKCSDHKFNLQSRSIKPVLRDIAQQEDIDISSRQLGQLATRNGMRDAINDLQSYAEFDGDTDWDERQTEDSPFAVTERLLRNKDYIGADSMTPPDTVEFLSENLPGEFEGVEFMRAMQALSEADKYNETVNRSQNYSWWRYAGDIAEEVGDLRVTEPYDGYMNIDYPRTRRNYQAKAMSDSGVATLYRELKQTDKTNFRASFNFHEFQNGVLPMLKSMSKDKKRLMVLEESLSPKSYKELGITQSEYESWSMDEVEQEETTISEFSDESENDKQGLMDF